MSALEKLKEWNRNQTLLAQVTRERDEAREEIEQKNRDYHALASELVYRGNSVQHWAKRADARGEAIDKVFAALGGADGTPVYELVGKVVAQRDALRAEITEEKRKNDQLQEAIRWAESNGIGVHTHGGGYEFDNDSFIEELLRRAGMASDGVGRD